ncbi:MULTISPECIES: bifunctional tRNA (5-methylaminomethyl-2-thiouridine)(34)-methyltransferase MnmD/FAD-dependent 5-carboxymethylaminomethyl-2-thiouridine(34) oxidoreductase MnmC [Halomonas]|uniref:bifunctional tRNA (5-methylaminomethyl-2-thiouridine)(34)-methyltransferase MnmD/FAD-dependent 5-carboxymethylaminomethyl-2-thiouridine(34) oxidoreductase MnmC n=1 Tax=Halomonas TaxID=2745 RepID=UPI001C991B38|nr:MULTISPECIES: bifunctional tRNA (5-methylaminomethyl-2-thiouridine)(34)-methyltransferase MnmD/FAD-dependent 5-carboxymethylaminomethyl-2-thiouridine(34) oxidoreductase MnmC [Halomonas]MBY5967559.1 bifunctional tRNA (5-methylaminomethyl-2-thiouridine)(34)-methyltransferase MnmD/FAD-dependent 5-carboxymethylaminomethyl-2-thiouridine(34) oxidoreductase MnmC [Halomonas denitrificans]MBY5983063.1 bifunctional tRNA (5-methylaminomethyl-2-thiouridine)(34)-methyltransferase MnmD/FAD-dependent 5-carbo
MTHAPDGLPALTSATPAELEWREESSGLSPHSRVFDDVYFSRHDGRAETEHVFIHANHLPQRFQEWTLERPFVIGETGFGTGLNMLCAWQAFDQHAPAGARLHLVSTERYPMSAADLAQALAGWPDLADRAAALIEAWPEPVIGVHRLTLSPRVTLDLHIGDSSERLALLDGRVDAWFLDGFAPAKNPDMWQPALFEQMAARSRPGATFATFTCAGIVKRGLKAAGFQWRKVPGHGRKREMLAGEIDTPPADKRRQATPWYSPPPALPHRRVAIIGAGIAGCATAEALARRGIEVTLIDSTAPGAGASGNEQGALYVKLAADTNHQSRVYLAGLLYSQRWLARLDGEGQLWSPCGVLQLAHGDREARRQRRFLEHHPLPHSVVHSIDAAQASQLAGVPVTAGGLCYPGAGWVKPRALCEFLVARPGVNLVKAQIHDLRASDQGWRLLGTAADGSQVAVDADQVVIATAHQANQFAYTQGLPLQPVRGQVSRWRLPPDAPAPQRVVCAGGYVAPPLEGVLTFGATFVPGCSDADTLPEDHAANLRELDQTLPGYTDRLRAQGITLSTESLDGRGGVRCASPDKSPYAGPLPDQQAWVEDYAVLEKDATRVPDTPGRHHRGLWISAAHGSRGLASAPLCAEVLASRICDEPLPLEAPLADHLHPGRRVIRDIIQGKRRH